MANNKQTAKIKMLISKMKPEVAKAFISAINKFSASLDFNEIVKLLDRGEYAQVLRLLSMEPKHLFELTEAVRSTFISGASAAASDLPLAIKAIFSFDGMHPRAVEIARSTAAQLVTAISESAVEAARAVITEGLSTNRSTRLIARDLIGRKVGKKRVGGIIGLTEPQSKSITRGRRLLESGKAADLSAYKKLKLRDRSYDKMIDAAIRGDKKLTPAAIDKILEAHKSKALSYRGKVVANDQTFSMISAGREEAYLQMKLNGDVEDVTVRWQHNLSPFPRDDHEEMDGTVISIGEKFKFADAEMSRPHDPEGGAKHSVGCKCIALYRIVVSKG